MQGKGRECTLDRSQSIKEHNKINSHTLGGNLESPIDACFGLLEKNRVIRKYACMHMGII